MFEQIFNRLPSIIKKKIQLIVRDQLLEEWRIIDKKIPRVDLKMENIKECKIILSREILLELLPKHAIVAELGVASGDFTTCVMKICSPKKLHLIDLWGNARYNNDKMNLVGNKFKNEIEGGQVEINRGYSIEMAEIFDDDYFDWIYIDTDHSYDTTKKELERYCRKVKKEGIIAGHDFITGNRKTRIRYGVIEAVYEFCVNHNWGILYLTAENADNPSFAIKRIV